MSIVARPGGALSGSSNGPLAQTGAAARHSASSTPIGAIARGIADAGRTSPPPRHAPPPPPACPPLRAVREGPPAPTEPPFPRAACSGLRDGSRPGRRRVADAAHRTAGLTRDDVGTGVVDRHHAVFRHLGGSVLGQG